MVFTIYKDVAEQLVYVYFASANFVWYIRTNPFIANFYILSQTFIFISLLIYYYPLLPKNFTDKLYLIVLNDISTYFNFKWNL
jgi:hypothetical protein